MITTGKRDICIAAAITLAALLAYAAEARAEAPHAAEVRIEHLTWTEIRDRLAAGHRTIVIPTGGTEQNGPHMVTGKHNLIVAATAERIARALGDALVAPVLAYVPEGDPARRTGHMAYPGTISLPEPVFAKVLEAAAESFKAHGFTTIALLGDSGGNQRAQEDVAARLSAAWRNDGVRVVNAAAYYVASDGQDWLARRGFAATAIGKHAGLRDTSELLAVAPDGVRRDKLSTGGDGADGDASKASREIGEALLASKVEAAVTEIRRAQAGVAVSAGADARPGVLARLKRLILR
jgi:creatinine amidohydrolase/Fe(II)-dependent formamide hydrolase-like protein